MIFKTQHTLMVRYFLAGDLSALLICDFRVDTAHGDGEETAIPIKHSIFLRNLKQYSPRWIEIRKIRRYQVKNVHSNWIVIVGIHLICLIRGQEGELESDRLDRPAWKHQTSCMLMNRYIIYTHIRRYGYAMGINKPFVIEDMNWRQTQRSSPIW